MKNCEPSATLCKLFLALFVVLFSFTTSSAQTRWTGTTNTDWFTATNWTAGIPSASVDVIIGDRSITNYPVINTTAASCKSLTLGGTNTGKLTMNANLTVAGNVTINSNGTLTQPANTITVGGNWSATGVYTGSSTTSAVFNGSSQTIGGTAAHFLSLTINNGSYVTLMANVTIDYKTVVNGTWDTNETPTYYKLTGATSFTIGATGTIKIKAPDAPSCFQFTGGPTLIPGCTVDYASTTVTQTVYSNFAYDNLRISGSGIKQLTGDYASWQTAAADVGNVYVASGTLDLFSYSLSRGAAGGTLTVANGAKLRIGGTNSLPTFSTYVFNTTSTVEYYGTTQVITPANYGNLTLTGSSTASFSIPSGKTVNCGNDFLISGGTFNVSNSTGTSSLIATGSYTQTGGTVNVSSSTGTGVVNINTDVNISGGTFNVIANALAPNTTVTINGDLNISSAARFNLETISSNSIATINVNGDFVSTGTSVANATGTGGVIDFGVGSIANNAININGNFTKSGAGTFGSTATTPAKGFVFNGTATQLFSYSGANSAFVQYTINSGATVKMTSGLTLLAGTTPACSFTVNGTLDFGTNTITSTTNPTFLLASTGKLITAHTGGINGSIAGTWASKTFSSGAQYEFNSAVANQTFGFTGLTITTPGTILVSNTGGTVSQDVNVTFGNSGNLIVNTNSILNSAAFTFAFGTGGNVLENGKLQTANANGFAGAATTTIISTNTPVITLGATSTIEYNGTISQNISAINYVNLTSSSTGARVLASTGTIGISGVFLAGTNAYTNTGSTVLFNGVVNQNVPSGFAFNSLTISNAAGVTLLGNISVSVASAATSTLSFINGKITTGTYKITVGQNVTVTGAGAGKYVYGNLERDFPKTNLAFTFDVGGSTYYSPVTITFAKFNGLGGLFQVGAVDGEHPNVASSSILTGNDIPRYWKVTNTGAVSYTTYSVALNWNSAENYTNQSITAMKVGSYNASAWTYPTLLGGTTTTSIGASGLNTDAQLVAGQGCTTVSAAFSYTASAFCTTGGTINIALGTGATAGIFSVDKTGLSIVSTSGAINLGASNVGTYVVTNTIGTGVCTKTASFTITVTSVATTTISYNGSPFCNVSGNTALPAISGTGGGTFSSTNGLVITPSSGLIDAGLSTASTTSYTVTYTISAAVCPQYQTTTTVAITAGGTWTGESSTNWSDTANWQCGLIPGNSSNVIIPAGVVNYPGIAGVTASVKNINVQSGATLSVTSNGTLKIAGVATVAGTGITATTGNIELNGTTAQTIGSGLFTSNIVKSLVISNSAGVTLNAPLRVTSMVSFGNVNNSVLNSNGYLTLVSTSSNSANLADITNHGVNTGNQVLGDVTVERYIQGKRAYRFLTAPVKTTTSMRANWMENTNNPSTSVNNNPVPGYGTHITGTGGNINGFDATSTNNPSLYTFDNANQSWVAAANTSAVFRPGAPYRIIVRGSRSTDLSNNNATPSSTTLRATGTLVTGPVTFTRTATGGLPALKDSIGGYSFIGNPYASSVDWGLIVASSTSIYPTLYIFDPTISGSNGRGGYVSYNAVLKVKNITSSLITKDVQSGQGFFVQTSGPNPTLTFNESYKSSSFLPVFRTDDVPNINVQLLLPSQVNTENSADGTAVYFSDEYSSKIGNEDSYKFTNQDENIAIISNGQTLSLEGRKPISGMDSVPLKIWQLTAKSYTLKVSLENFPTNIEAYLEDKFLKTTAPLNSGENLVPFIITSDAQSSATNRFKIVFETLATLPVRLTGIKAYVKDKGVQVDWVAESESNMDLYEVERSADAQHFETIASTKAKNNPGISAAYNALDVNPNVGDNYYRIKAIEKSGEVKTSEVVRVQIVGARTGISVINNPVQGNSIQLLLNNLPAGVYIADLINGAGEKVYESKINNPGGIVTHQIDLNSYLPSGVYQLQINNGTLNKTITILKQ